MNPRIQTTLSVTAIVFSTLALCMGGAFASGLIGSKQIRNNSIKSIDLRNNGVQSTDIANGTVNTPDIAENAVTPTDLELPPPVEESEGVGQPQPVVERAFSKIAKVGTYEKVQAESKIEVSWSGAIGPGQSTNCLFEIRVNGQPPKEEGGQVFATRDPVNVSTTALFEGLPIGPVSVEVWAAATGAATPTPTCTLDPAGTVNSTFVISEVVQ